MGDGNAGSCQGRIETLSLLDCFSHSSVSPYQYHVAVCPTEGSSLVRIPSNKTSSFQAKDLSKARGLDNLLYSSDVFFSCFADLALVSPVEYYKAGEGSLMQVVITPAQVRAGGWGGYRKGFRIHQSG